MIQLSTMPDDVLLICGYCLVGDDNDGTGDGDDVGIVAGLNKNLLSNGVVIDGGVR